MEEFRILGCLGSFLGAAIDLIRECISPQARDLHWVTRVLLIAVALSFSGGIIYLIYLVILAFTPSFTSPTANGWRWVSAFLSFVIVVSAAYRWCRDERWR